MSCKVADSNNISYSVKSEEYILYKYRYVISFLYILLSNNNTIMWYAFSPLQTTLSNVYSQSITYTNFCTILISNVSYIPANFVGTYIIDTFGLKIGLHARSILTLIGLWLRCLSKHSFLWIFAGQLFAGMAQPFFYCTPSKISNMWFGVKERDIATTVMTTSVTLGVTLGTFLPQYFVDINAKNDVILDQIQKMMFWSAKLGSASYFLMVVFMKEKPLTPPSKAAEAETYSYLKSLKTLLKDKNSMLLICSTAVINGSIINFLATLQQAVEPFGINGDQVGDILSIGNGLSFVGAFVVAVLITRNRKYNLVLIVSSVSSLLILVGNLFAAESSNPYLFGTVVLIYSVLLSPILPISYEYSVELAFPVAESTIGGIWSSINQLSSLVESLIIDFILNNSETTSTARLAFVIMILYQLLGMIPLFFVQENLKRTSYEKKDFLLTNQEGAIKLLFQTKVVLNFKEKSHVVVEKSIKINHIFLVF